MAGIQLSGLSSGLDTESLIQGLMQVEQAPRARMVLQQTAAKARQTGLQQVEDKLKSLKLASDDLSSSLTWNMAQKATSSDTSFGRANLVAGAAPGTYSLNVTQLATNEQRTFTFAPPGADQTVTLNGQSLTVATGATIDQVADQINTNSAYGASAVNVGGNLVLTASKTGTAVTITNGAGTPFTEQAAKARPFQSAAYTIDGVSYSSPSNTISATSGATGIVTGVDVTLTGTGSFTVEVTPPAIDKATVTSKVKAFVDAYNAAQDLMAAKIAEKRVPNATTDSDAAKGALWGDSTLETLQSALRESIGVFKQSANGSGIDELAELGISTGAPSGDATFSQDAVNGKLVLDTTKLSDALDSDPTSVQRLFGGITGTDGFAQAFNAQLTPYTQTGGVMDARQDAANASITLLNDSLARLDDRLAKKEESLRQMFTNLELNLQKIKSQGTELLAKLGIQQNNS
jgi:flagellar hook-associated protein 2